MGFGTVQTQPLDHLWSGLGGARLTKIDVEGAELRALAGAERLLQSGALPLIHFEYNPYHLAHHESQPRELFKLLQDVKI